MSKRPLSTIILFFVLFVSLNFGAAGIGLLSENPNEIEKFVLLINAILAALGGYYINKAIP